MSFENREPPRQSKADRYRRPGNVSQRDDADLKDGKRETDERLRRVNELRQLMRRAIIKAKEEELAMMDNLESDTVN